MIYTTKQGPCPASFDLNQQEGRVETVLSAFGATSVFGGPATTTLPTKQRTGLYLVCTWIEGPNVGEVDGAASTSVTVGTPAPPAPPSPKLKLSKAAASHKHGVAVAGSTVSGFTGKLAVSAACGSSTAKRTVTARNRRFSSALRPATRVRPRPQGQAHRLMGRLQRLRQADGDQDRRDRQVTTPS